jgi:sulfatase modifying factor 1
MGSPEGEGSYDEHPQHRVRITKGFWLGKYEVTNEQYRAFCEVSGHRFASRNSNGPKHPVTLYAGWLSAKAYCDHHGLALPTEAQWEYAARGPEGRKYPWGNEWETKRCCNFWERSDGPFGGDLTTEVGSLPAGDSWCGASDLAGNVWEYCTDVYDDGYYAQSPIADPRGPATEAYHVLRGGSCKSTAYSCRSAGRGNGGPDWWFDSNGFRVAFTP